MKHEKQWDRQRWYLDSQYGINNHTPEFMVMLTATKPNYSKRLPWLTIVVSLKCQNGSFLVAANPALRSRPSNACPNTAQHMHAQPSIQSHINTINTSNIVVTLLLGCSWDASPLLRELGCLSLVFAEACGYHVAASMGVLFRGQRRHFIHLGKS